MPLRHTVGMPSLAFANTIQNALRPIMLIVLLRFAIGPLYIQKMLPAIAKIYLASGIMVAVILGLEQLVIHIEFLHKNTLFSQALSILGIGGIATIVYFGSITLLKVEEITIVKKAISSKFSKVEQ